MPDEEVIEERRLEIQVKVKRKGKNRKNKDDGSTEEGDGDPLGRKIQKMIQPTHGIIIIKSVKIKCEQQKGYS